MEISISSPWFISLFLGIAVLILALFVLPGRQRIDVAAAGSKLNMREQTQRALHAAGVFDRAPSIIGLALFGLIVFVGLLLYVFTGSLIYVAFAPFIVLGAAYLNLRGRQRRFLLRANAEMVPFINKVSGLVTAGLPVQTAYVQAVDDSRVLREVLADSAARISAGGNFAEEVVGTISLLPFRMWASFVRQLELYEQVGGQIAKSLEATARQITKMQRLQAEARADFAAQQNQQRIILAIIVLFLFLAVFVMGDGGGAFVRALLSPVGLLMILGGVAMMAAGFIFVNHQMREIEKKVFF